MVDRDEHDRVAALIRMEYMGGSSAYGKHRTTETTKQRTRQGPYVHAWNIEDAAGD
jgi:hypothetical protein